MANVPFDKSFVLKITARNMKQCVDTSISKTFARIKDFDDNQEKSKEIFETLSQLHMMRATIDEFQASINP